MFEELIAHAKGALERGDMGAAMAAEKALRYTLNLRPKPFGFEKSSNLILTAHEEICRGIDELISQDRSALLRKIKSPD